MQTERPVVDGVKRPNRCPADFVAPRGSGKADYVGLFAVTAGMGVEKKEKQFLADHDDYSAIMLKALADRPPRPLPNACTSACAPSFWGYAADEAARQRRADRRALPRHPPGAGLSRPAPTTSVKRELFRVLGSRGDRHGLTESLAMTPAASVSGFYLAHPQASYFNVGKVGEDQLADWAHAALRRRCSEAFARFTA